MLYYERGEDYTGHETAQTVPGLMFITRLQLSNRIRLSAHAKKILLSFSTHTSRHLSLGWKWGRLVPMQRANGLS